MKVKLVSFDAAHTLIDVNWHPGGFAVLNAREAGLALDPVTAAELYDRLLRTRWMHFRELNLTRDEAQTDAFWNELTADWLAQLGILDVDPAALSERGRERMYGPNSPCFRLYSDTLSGLDAVAALGLPMVILSNWDISLHRTVRSLGIEDRFLQVFASLEHGVEKPETELFRVVEEATGFAPEEILHVGDHPLDDLQGAIGAGWHAALLDRASDEVSRPRIPSLHQVPEAIAWIG